MDKKSRNILFKTCWNGKGWITGKNGHIGDASFAHAKNLMSGISGNT